MRNRGLWGVGFIAVAIVRFAFALSYLHSVGHSTATAASPPTDTMTTMAGARQHFRQTPDNIYTSPGREIISSDGTTREFGDNPAQAIRDSSEDDLDSDVPEPAPTPIFVPGKPMMEPAPSR